jgi:hypothetical protein
MRRSIRRALLQKGVAAALALASLSVAGCSDNNTTNTPTTPTTPTAPSVTETFSGTLTTNGAASYAFVVTTSGIVTVTMTAVDPSTSQSFGLGLGTWNGQGCQIIIANDAALVNTTVTGTVSAATSLCARVYDASGKVTDPLTYTITVVHP